MPAALLALIAALVLPMTQDAVTPGLRAAVDRFYAAQEAEDTAAYLALWSKDAERPRAAQLEYIFGTGDDKFSGITIERVGTIGDRIVVRVSATRDRTSAAARRPDGSPVVSHTSLVASLTFVREDGDWKLLREDSAVDGLATVLIATPAREDRARVMAADQELVGPVLVLSLSRQADELAQTQQYARAQPVYELALEVAQKIGDIRLQARALQNIGNALYFQRNLQAALTAYQQRLVLERDAADEEGIASALLGIATIRYSFFEYTDALATYREALGIQERLKDGPGLARTLISAGNVQYLQGDFAGAMVDYRRSRDLSHQSADTMGEARALEGLGRSLTAQGDFPAALEAYAGVLEEGRARDDRSMQGRALQSIGEIHFRLGNLETARALFEQSRGHFEALEDLGNVGRVWQAAALTDLAATRFAASEQEYRASSTVCAAARDNECVARALVGLAFAQASQEHYDPAIGSYRQAIAAFTSLRRPEEAARAEVGLSRALLGTKDNRAALAAAEHARDRARAISRDDVLWRAQMAEARAWRRLADPAKATTAARDAVTSVERMVGASLDHPGDPLPDDSAAAYTLLAVLQADAGDAVGAFVTVEQGRAHALRTVLSTNERDISRGMTPTERNDERRAAAELVALRAQLDHETGLPRPDAARVAKLQQAAEAAGATRRALRQQLFARLPDLATWRGLAPPITLEDLPKLLHSEGMIAAELVIDEDDLLVITAARRGERTEVQARLSAISRQALAERIARAVDPAALQTAEAWRRAAGDLVSAIPAGAWTDMAAASRVVLVPDDVLWRVPFEALPAGAGYLADRTSIVYAGSLTSLVRAPAVPAGPAAVPLVAVGSPDLSPQVRERVKSTAPAWMLRPPEAADREMRGVIALFTEPAAVMLAGTDATESAFRAQAPAAAALHFAAPFRMNGASPLFSPLLLSPGQADAGGTPENDGVLEPREIMNLDLQARVVVFSDGASMSMRGSAAAADTVRWAWRAAGVPSIVMPRWTSDEAAASTALGEFYKRVSAGEAPEDALQAARAAMRSIEATSAPYFWAGWMIIGR